jgi:hypothetical protein
VAFCIGINGELVADSDSGMDANNFGDGDSELHRSSDKSIVM